jgi:hypothetical protein
MRDRGRLARQVPRDSILERRHQLPRTADQCHCDPLALSRARSDQWLWHEIGRRGAITFDRLRLVAFADDAELDATTRGSIEAWVTTGLAQLPMVT